MTTWAAGFKVDLGEVGQTEKDSRSEGFPV